MEKPIELAAILTQKIRLDAYLSEIFNISRREARKYCEKGLVRVNNKIFRSGDLIKDKDCISIKLEPIRAIPGNNKCNLNLEIIYDDKNLIILNKPSSTHCIKLKDDETDTVADWLAINFPETKNASNDIRESGLINRIDYYTSGILIAAKKQNVWKELRQLQANKQMLKTYYALVWGKVSVQKINFSLKNKNSFKVTVDNSSDESNIETNIKSCKYIKFKSDIFTLVKIQGHAFKRHQLRAHLSLIEHPLVGDEVYLGKKSNLIKRSGFFLHSESIQFNYKNNFYNFSARSLELEKFMALKT